MSIDARLAELGIDLPTPAVPVANYVSFVQTGNLVHISGQLSNDASGGIKGTVGVDVSPEQANAAARLCAINLMAQMKVACDGDDAGGLGHPRVWLAISPETGFVDCGYCDKRFVIDRDHAHDDH